MHIALRPGPCASWAFIGGAEQGGAAVAPGFAACGRAQWALGGRLAGRDLCSFRFDHDVGVFDRDGKRLGRVRALHKLGTGFH